MLAHERLQTIVDLINQKGFANNRELALMFEVSEATIRRDVEELEQQGLLIRIHGGAKRLLDPSVLRPENELNMSERFAVHAQEKQKVAAYAASFVNDGDCIFLDGGTSVSAMIPFLKHKRVKIVTHSHLIAQMADASYDITLLGGHYDPRYAMSVGPLTLENLQRFNFDASFIGCAGIDFEESLLYTAEMDTLAIKETAMQLSHKNYLLVDSSKLMVKGFCRHHGFEAFNAILCDQTALINQENSPEQLILV